MSLHCLIKGVKFGHLSINLYDVRQLIILGKISKKGYKKKKGIIIIIMNSHDGGYICNGVKVRCKVSSNSLLTIYKYFILSLTLSSSFDTFEDESNVCMYESMYVCL